MKISFYECYDFDETSIRLVQGVIGLYFIFLEQLSVPYPFKNSRLIYIGMSESKENSIGSRLRDHRSGMSGNLAISNYVKRHTVRFSFLGLPVLRVLGTSNILELESFFLKTFLMEHGAFPISNNQSGVAFPTSELRHDDIAIDWEMFS